MHITTDPQALRLLSTAGAIAYGAPRRVRVVAAPGTPTEPLVAALLAAIDADDGFPVYVAPAGASLKERRFVLQAMTPRRAFAATHFIATGHGLTGHSPDAVIIDRPRADAADWYARAVIPRLRSSALVVVIDDGGGAVLDPAEAWTAVELPPLTTGA